MACPLRFPRRIEVECAHNAWFDRLTFILPRAPAHTFEDRGELSDDEDSDAEETEDEDKRPRVEREHRYHVKVPGVQLLWQKDDISENPAVITCGVDIVTLFLWLDGKESWKGLRLVGVRDGGRYLPGCQMKLRPSARDKESGEVGEVEVWLDGVRVPG